MNRILSPSYRRWILRASSLPLAAILLLSLALVLASMWLELSEPGWLILLTIGLSLGLLLLLLRQGPVVWRDITHHRSLHNLKRVQCMKHQVSWRFKVGPAGLIDECESVLQRHGYRVHREINEQTSQLSAIKGRLNRVGFVLVHLAMLFILIGTLLDSQTGLRYLVKTGQVNTESRDIALNEMSRQSRIPARSTVAFQGSVDLQAGQIADEVRIKTATGYLTRHLPHPVSVRSVALDNSQSLLENNFLTHVAILDARRDAPVNVVLGSNRPFRYQDFVYYQQTVLSEKSELSITLWPLQHTRVTPLHFRTNVGTDRNLQTRLGRIGIRFVDLRPRNVLPVQEEIGAKHSYKNIGPSLIYHVDAPDSEQREFINYLLPVKQYGRYFFVTGWRDTQAGSDFNYIHIPVDHDAGLTAYLDFYAALYDGAVVDRAIDNVLKSAGTTAKSDDAKAKRETLLNMFGLFRDGGQTAIEKNIISHVAAENLDQSRQLSNKLIRSLYYSIFRELKKKQKITGAEETDVLFFEDAMRAISDMAELALPFYLQLQDMKFNPAVRLLVSYRPGEMIFMTGWLILLTGLLFSFYSWYRRVWILFEEQEGDTQVSMAGMGRRSQQRFTREFNALFASMQEAMSDK